MCVCRRFSLEYIFGTFLFFLSKYVGWIYIATSTTCCCIEERFDHRSRCFRRFSKIQTESFKISTHTHPRKNTNTHTHMEEGEGERISLPRKDIRSQSFDNVRSHSFDSGLRDSLLQGNDDDDFATLSNESNRSWSQRLSYVKKIKLSYSLTLTQV